MRYTSYAPTNKPAHTNGRISGKRRDNCPTVSSATTTPSPRGATASPACQRVVMQDIFKEERIQKVDRPQGQALKRDHYHRDREFQDAEDPQIDNWLRKA